MADPLDGSDEPAEPSSSIAEAMQRHLAALAGRGGGLGRFEQIATKLATIQGRVPPFVERKAAIVCAADHGIAAEGVSTIRASETEQLVRAFIDGQAAINIFARTCDFETLVVDCGMRIPVASPAVRDLRAGRGTANFRTKPAMSHEQLFRCVENGRKLAGEVGGEGITLGADVVAIGDMGRGNTTTGAALAVALGAPEEVIEHGRPGSAEADYRKRSLIREAVKRHAPFSNPYDALRKVGGFEFATIVGVILGLRQRGVACVLDGFAVTAAAYAAAAIDPHVTSFMFAGHRGKLPGHGALLEALGLDPILDFELGLGEGAGAVLGGFHVDLAARLAFGMRSIGGSPGSAPF
ncbi:MAG: nicotinate-nucleotide--dimethylbenzimidazole phosphoribosyltransferase [bacterium]